MAIDYSLFSESFININVFSMSLITLIISLLTCLLLTTDINRWKRLFVIVHVSWCIALGWNVIDAVIAIIAFFVMVIDSISIESLEKIMQTKFVTPKAYVKEKIKTTLKNYRKPLTFKSIKDDLAIPQMKLIKPDITEIKDILKRIKRKNPKTPSIKNITKSPSTVTTSSSTSTKPSWRPQTFDEYEAKGPESKKDTRIGQIRKNLINDYMTATGRQTLDRDTLKKIYDRARELFQKEIRK